MTSQIEALIERFATGVDISIDIANDIELALDECFPGDDYIQETVEILAMYRPGGGEFLFDAAATRQRLAETLAYMVKMRS